MKQIAFGAFLLLLAFSVMGCSAGGDNDPRTINDFKEAFVESGYELKNEGEPLYQLINAEDGIIFYIDHYPVKIYKYKDSSTLKKAINTYSFMSDWEQNGLFIIETSHEDAIEFFKTIS